MTQKIIKVGNSLAVTLPAEDVRRLQLRPGLEIGVKYDEEEVIFRVDLKPKKGNLRGKVAKTHVSPKFEAWANKFINENIDLFKELAHRNEISHT